MTHSFVNLAQPCKSPPPFAVGCRVQMLPPDDLLTGVVVRLEPHHALVAVGSRYRVRVRLTQLRRCA